MSNIVITGGSRGIGAAAVEYFAAQGHRVHFLYEKNHTAAQKVAQEIEENQHMAMKLWRGCGNGVGWFALKFDDRIYMVSLPNLIGLRASTATLPEKLVAQQNMTLENWLRVRR